MIKNVRQLKGYTAIRFLREFKPQNWTRAQILTVLNLLEAVYLRLRKIVVERVTVVQE